MAHNDERCAATICQATLLFCHPTGAVFFAAQWRDQRGAILFDDRNGTNQRERSG